MLTAQDSRELMDILTNLQRGTRSEVEKLRYMRLKTQLRIELRERGHYEKDMPPWRRKS